MLPDPFQKSGILCTVYAVSFADTAALQISRLYKLSLTASFSNRILIGCALLPVTKFHNILCMNIAFQPVCCSVRINRRNRTYLHTAMIWAQIRDHISLALRNRIRHAASSLHITGGETLTVV